MFGDCPVCREPLKPMRAIVRRRAAFKVFCPLDANHFDLVIKDAFAVRELAARVETVDVR